MDYEDYEDHDEMPRAWDVDSMKFEIAISSVQEAKFVREISGMLAERVTKSLLSQIEEKANALIEEKVFAKLEEVVSDVVEHGLTRELQPSDEFSNPKGGPITPLEFIAKGAESFLEQHVDDKGVATKPSQYNRTSRRIDRYMSGVVTAQFEKELEAEVRKMKDQIKEQMNTAAAEWMAKFQAETVSGVEKAKALARRI